jgi:ATP-dependent helicase/nuclease subunit A
MEFYRLDPPARVPAKLPVSRLHPVAPKAPAARPVRGAAPTRAAEEGTAMHIVMQHVNLRAVRGEESVLHQIEGMVALGLLSEEQAGMVDAGAVAAFASGELGTRMKRAATLRREWPFTLRIGAKEAIDGAPPGETVLVQGVMDACFVEDGAWVLVDFKTDRVAGEPLELAAKRHAGQLGFYARALRTLSDMPVKEQWVYLFRANRGVRIG